MPKDHAYTDREAKATWDQAYKRPPRDRWTQPADSSAGCVLPKKITPNVVADIITESNTFARDIAGRLLIFENGVYRARGDQAVRTATKDILLSAGRPSNWTARLGDEVIRYILDSAPELWARPPMTHLNLKNGLLDLSTRTLQLHAPGWFSQVQLPVMFDPEADCPACKQFVSDAFPRDAEALAWQIPAWLILPETSIQKAILLHGDGSNGKSTYLRGISRLGLNFASLVCRTWSASSVCQRNCKHGVAAVL